MRIQLIRHATLRITINNKTILVDPVLSPKGKMDPIPNVVSKNKNPLTELPIEANTITKVDAVLLTHTHKDHFDDVAAELLPKNMTMFCQAEDNLKLVEKGFFDVTPIEKSYIWNDITFNRIEGQHGKGGIAKQMGKVSGYVITTKGEPSIYIAGDTIWCSEVEKALEKYNPKIIISFAGYAQLTDGGTPITMDKEDVFNLCKKMPKSKIIVVHMEAWNHCVLTRNELRSFLNTNYLLEQVLVPNDGDTIECGMV